MVRFTNEHYSIFQKLSNPSTHRTGDIRAFCDSKEILIFLNPSGMSCWKLGHPLFIAKQSQWNYVMAFDFN